MNTYLCTRNASYANPNCLRHTDLEARQGYYVTAESLCDAIAQMVQHFPNDTTGFTVQLWQLWHPGKLANRRIPDLKTVLPR